MASYTLLAWVIGICIVVVSGHGRMIDPPQRSSLWRVFPGQGFVPNYSDNQLFCGGFTRQWKENDGKCGTCGDPYDGERKNEAGGVYATGFIGRRYQKGQDIAVEIDLTANHLGYMQFKICPQDDITTQVTQECLDRHLLEIAGQPGVTKYKPGNKIGFHIVKLALPVDMTCDQCVIQWHYVAGNNNGCDKLTGRCCKGCGAQETFINCADIAIEGDGGANPTTTKSPGSTSTPPRTSTAKTTTKVTSPPSTTAPKPTKVTSPPSTTAPKTTKVTSPPSTTAPKTTKVTSPPSTTAPKSTKVTSPSSTTAPKTTTKVTSLPSTTTPAPPTTSNTPSGSHNPTCAYDEKTDCIGVGVYDGLGYEGWCNMYCGIKAAACSADLCRCRCKKTLNCYAVGVFATISGMDGYCHNNCQNGCANISHICKCD